MITSRTVRRLKRLTDSGICRAENASKYADELRELADRLMTVEKAKKRSKVFKALADENRLRILGLLKTREMCVCEIMVALSFTQPTASHHLGILENVGLVKNRKEGKWVFYSITAHRLAERIDRVIPTE